MVTLFERFLLDLAADARLRQPRCPGVDLLNTTAGVFSFAGELSDKQSRGANCNTATEVLLKRFIGKLLGFDEVAEAQDFVAQLAVLFFPGGCQCSLTFRDTHLTLLVAIRPSPRARASLDCPVGIVVVRIGHPAAAVLRPLLTFDLLPWLDHVVAKLREKGVFFAYGGDGGRTDVQAAGIFGDGILLLLMCGPFENQLHEPEGVAFDNPLDQAQVLHPAGQRMSFHAMLVLQVEQRRQFQPAPENTVIPPADTGGVAFPFDRTEPAMPLEPRPAPAAVGVLLDGAKGASGYFLDGECIEVVAKPAGLAGLGGKGVQTVFLEVMKASNRFERLVAGLALWQFSGRLIHLRLTHQVEPPERLMETSVIELPGRIQAHVQYRFVVRRCFQWYFMDEGIGHQVAVTGSSGSQCTV